MSVLTDAQTIADGIFVAAAAEIAGLEREIDIVKSCPARDIVDAVKLAVDHAASQADFSVLEA